MLWTSERIARLVKEDRLHLFYNSNEWRRLRAEIMADFHGECYYCRVVKHIHERATVAHHLNHVKDRPDLALSKTYIAPCGKLMPNIIPVCDACHDREHPKQFKWQKEKKPVTVERW